MSERMIEMQRARLLAAKGSATSSSAGNTQNGSQQPTRQLLPGQLPATASYGGSGGGMPPQTPQQAAAAAVRMEEMQMQRFFYRLQARDDTRPDTLTTGPTVPTALTRRILHRQGVGYLDDTVAAVVSASADRFLATVLHQAAACRDQRLKGAELAKEASRHRKRHVAQYEADTEDRARRKGEKARKRERSNLAAIEAGDVLKKSGKTPAKEGESTPTKSKKKKKTTDDIAANGRKPKQKDDVDDDDTSYDSVDEEEEYYRNYYGNPVGEMEDGDDEEEDDEMLILRDVARPLEAWDFHLTGKEGMYQRPEESDDDNGADLPDEDDNDIDDLLELEAAENEALAQKGSADQGDKKMNGDDKQSKGGFISPTPPAVSGKNG
jgi:hypothetical protein